ncbi:MAG: ShlB/FhaC/HecB family hemolysin secretion/activation protein [Cyanobacteria bacterium J06639_14]
MSSRFLGVSCSAIAAISIHPAGVLAIEDLESVVREQLLDAPTPRIQVGESSQGTFSTGAPASISADSIAPEDIKSQPQFSSDLSSPNNLFTPSATQTLPSAQPLSIPGTLTDPHSLASPLEAQPAAALKSEATDPTQAPINPVSSTSLSSNLSVDPIEPVAISPSDHPSPTSILPPSPPPLLAQVDPSQDRFPTDPGLPEPLPEEDVPADPLPSPVETQPPDSTIPFTVNDIQVTGSTLFDAATFDEIVAPYENREVTLSELQEAANAITQLYLNGGYITSRAVVGAQNIVDGVVQIQVIEGELEDIQVEGTDRLQDYVRARVELGGTRPLNQARLEDQLRLLRIDPMFDEVEASLRAGSGVGKSRLIVRVTEANMIGGSVFSDSYSPPAVGEVRFGARLEFRNLAGLGDTLFSSASVTNTEGSNVYELGYRVPINPMNGTLQFRFAPNDFRITDPDQPAFAFDTEGSSDTYEVSVRQPLIRTPRDEFALSLIYRHRQGSTLIGGIITDDSRINAFSFGQDYVHRDINGAWALQSQFRFGDERSDLPSGNEGSFFSWLGQVQRVQRLGPDHLLTLQSSLQLSGDSLPGSEQFFIGGGLSVRGYDQNQRFGDNGLRFAIEDRITVTRDETGLPFFQVLPFLEGGYVWNNDGSTRVTDNNFLLGTGVGFLLNPTEKLSARADLAYPLIDIEELSTDDPPGLRFYFSVSYRF